MKVLKVSHNHKVKSVALFPGYDSSELLDLLHAVFEFDEEVLGFQTEDGLVVPLRIACEEPNVFPDTLVSIVVSHNNKSNKSKTTSNKENSSTVAPSTATNKLAIEDEDVADDDIVDTLKSEIASTIDSFHTQGILSPQDVNALKLILNSPSILLIAAYSVAVNTNDAEYLAEIFRDIGQSLQTEDGSSACEAQSEVLEIADQLYQLQHITESQLLYLRHLVLIRDESVASLYDEYQDDFNVEKFAYKLHSLVNVHPYSVKSSTDVKDEVKEDDEEDENIANTYDDDGDEEDLGYVMQNVVARMLARGVVSSLEASKLLDMIEKREKAVVEGYALFQGDESSSSLSEYLLGLLPKPIVSTVSTVSDNSNMNTSKAVDNSSEMSSLDKLLSSLKLSNEWQTVPKEFVEVIFTIATASNANILSIENAITLCDLFKGGYDFVESAWEVYKVQHNLADFIDTLKRILRDVSGSQRNAKPEASNANASGANTNNNSQVDGDIDDKRREAIIAVKRAKDELLVHSITMLTKQNIISENQGEDLLKRSRSGDVLVDAAIDSYSMDKNVNEFLDSLYILATHSQEELKSMLQESSTSAATSTTTSASTNTKSIPITSNSSAFSDSKAEEGDDSNIVSSMETKIYIRQMIIEITQQQIMNTSQASLLLHLLNKDDNRITAAYEVYLEKKDLEDFIDSLIRISTYELSKLQSEVQRTSQQNSPEKSSTSTISNPKSPETQNKSPASTVTISPSKDARFDVSMEFEDGEDEVDEEEGERDGEIDNGPLLSESDQKVVLNILATSQQISNDDRDLLCQLIDNKISTMQIIFTNYEQNKDVHQLISSLKLVLDKVREITNTHASNNHKNSSNESKQTWTNGSVVRESDLENDEVVVDEEEEDEEDEEEDDYEDDDDDDNDEGLDEDDRETIEQRFLDIIQTMRLDQIETSALRLAIARNDDSIRQALDKYRQTQHDETLIKDLRLIANTIIDQTKSEQFSEENDQVLPARETREAWSKERDDDDEDEDNDEEDDEEDDDDDDDEEEDDDEPAEVKSRHASNKLTSQMARNHVFPMLLAELSKEGLLSSYDSQMLLSEFRKENVTINAALDVYDMDSDMAELVDTLQRIASGLTVKK